MPNVDEVLKGVRDAMTVKRIYGEAVERDGTTVIPAAYVFASGGGGGDNQQNGGVGFTLRARPAGAYVIRDGVVTWRPAVDATRIAIVVGLMIACALRRRRR
ncbi:MAG: sporulation protein [Gaiellaceae bacterium]